MGPCNSKQPGTRNEEPADALLVLQPKKPQSKAAATNHQDRSVRGATSGKGGMSALSRNAISALSTADKVLLAASLAQRPAGSGSERSVRGDRSMRGDRSTRPSGDFNTCGGDRSMRNRRSSCERMGAQEGGGSSACGQVGAGPDGDAAVSDDASSPKRRSKLHLFSDHAAPAKAEPCSPWTGGASRRASSKPGEYIDQDMEYALGKDHDASVFEKLSLALDRSVRAGHSTRIRPDHDAALGLGAFGSSGPALMASPSTKLLLRSKLKGASASTVVDLAAQPKRPALKGCVSSATDCSDEAGDVVLQQQLQHAHPEHSHKALRVAAARRICSQPDMGVGMDLEPLYGSGAHTAGSSGGMLSPGSRLRAGSSRLPPREGFDGLCADLPAECLQRDEPSDEDSLDGDAEFGVRPVQTRLGSMLLLQAAASAALRAVATPLDGSSRNSSRTRAGPGGPAPDHSPCSPKLAAVVGEDAEYELMMHHAHSLPLPLPTSPPHTNGNIFRDAADKRHASCDGRSGLPGSLHHGAS